MEALSSTTQGMLHLDGYLAVSALEESSPVERQAMALAKVE
ncbi:hypothetical protein A2U01_0078307, partial [Trifolium medium]|nr:hypothetical protein [Trifolium medium]